MPFIYQAPPAKRNDHHRGGRLVINLGNQRLCQPGLYESGPQIQVVSFIPDHKTIPVGRLGIHPVEQIQVIQRPRAD